jgi:hypothetical protein
MPEADPSIIQQAQELKDRMVRGCPNSFPVLETFSSGAFMLHFSVAGQAWVMEYMPSMRAFGVSKVTKATFAWEGFENGFKTFGEAETFLRGLFPQ